MSARFTMNYDGLPVRVTMDGPLSVITSEPGLSEILNQALSIRRVRDYEPYPLKAAADFLVGLYDGQDLEIDPPPDAIDPPGKIY